VSSLEQLGGKLLVIFDGHCGLCHRSVRWLLRRDRRDRLRFAASESPQVAGLLARHEFSTPDSVLGPRTILVVSDLGGQRECVLLRSEAILALLRPLRDLGYRLNARWRYRIWGRLESCPAPTAEERGRFL